MTGVFVTATDTDAGKTEVTLGLMAALQHRGLRTLGMKPVASGCKRTAHGLRNDDALRIQAQASVEAPYEHVNPYAFEPPMAPHIAAGRAGVEIGVQRIGDAYRALAKRGDWVVVEGVGGWRVPLSPSLALDGLPVALGIPVLLVVGLKLGCLNHALLTAEAIRARGIRLAGWVATVRDPDMLAREENLATLAGLIHAPSLGAIPWLESPGAEIVARSLNIDTLLGSASAG